jgi:deoxyribose-phosphate aldolase
MAPAIGPLIEHTLLKPEATAADIERLCAEAVQYRFKAVCINPYWVSRAARVLANSKVALCTVAGFPFGATHSRIKSAEAELALSEGADEVDMVLNLGAVRGGDFDAAEADILAVREVTAGHLLKVIVEATALSEAELVRVVEVAAGAGADLIKTSTGYHPTGGARVADVELIKKTLNGAPIGIKASGGIREHAFAVQLIQAGATRLGASSGISLIAEESAARTTG